MLEEKEIKEIIAAFWKCRKKLRYLPNKKWKTLEQYRKIWDFISKADLLDNIAELNMSFDYMYSLNEWFLPTLTIKERHGLICIRIISSIHEAIIYDYIYNILRAKKWEELLYKCLKIDRNKKKLQYDEIVRGSFAKLIYFSRKSKFLDKNWFKYLHEINELRNIVHPSKSVDKQRLKGLPPHKLDEKLDEFKEYLKKKC